MSLPGGVAVFDPATTPGPGGRAAYAAFRIPAIVACGSWLLAFCEGRRDSAADSGQIDLVLRRSPDGGRSWQPLQVICRVEGATSGNPAPVTVPGSGTVVLLSVRNAATADESAILAGRCRPADSRRVFVQRSVDAGASFDAPVEITPAVTRPDWRWYATGPGHGIALAAGPHRGRLLVPANHSSPAGPGLPPAAGYGGHCLLSDDGGRTWFLGFVDDDPGGSVNANESTAAELPEGPVCFSARNQHGTPAVSRVQAYSLDGGRSLQAPYRACPDLRTPIVQGSLLQVPDGPLLYSGPCDPSARVRMGLHRSDDGGRTWSAGLVLDEGPAGYSDLVALGPDRIGLLYESGTVGPYDTIRFQPIEREHWHAGFSERKSHRCG